MAVLGDFDVWVRLVKDMGEVTVQIRLRNGVL